MRELTNFVEHFTCEDCKGSFHLIARFATYPLVFGKSIHNRFPAALLPATAYNTVYANGENVRANVAPLSCLR